MPTPAELKTAKERRSSEAGSTSNGRALYIGKGTCQANRYGKPGDRGRADDAAAICAMAHRLVEWLGICLILNLSAIASAGQHRSSALLDQNAAPWEAVRQH